MKNHSVADSDELNSEQFSLQKNGGPDFDLQEILLQKIQNTIFSILDDPILTNDLFDLPNEALRIVFSSSETCIGELKLFKAIKSKIEAL